MKKITLTLICAMAVLLAAACQKAERKDANGNTPTDVVNQMYKAIQANDFETAVTFNKIPDTVKISPIGEVQDMEVNFDTADENVIADTALVNHPNIYEQFKEYPVDTTGKKVKVIIPGEDWKAFMIERMKKENENFTLVSWEIVKEEISKTDPNSAKVKTKIVIKTNGVQSETECSFPLKRENNVWLIIG